MDAKMDPFKHNFKIAIFLFLVFNFSYSQSNDGISTLKMKLASAQGLERISILRSLLDSLELIKAYPEARFYAFQLLADIPDIDKDTANMQVLKSLGRCYYYAGIKDSGLIYTRKYLAAVHHAQLSFEEGWAHHFLGLILRNMGQTQEAILQYDTSIQIRQQINDLNGLSSTYNNLGILYQNMGNFNSAIESYEKSLEIKKKLAIDKDQLANSYINFGQTYFSLGFYEQAIENYYTALNLYEETNNQWGIAATYNNIGIVFQEQRNWTQAIEFYDSSLVLALQSKSRDLLPRLYMNLGDVYQKLGDNERNIAFLKKGLEIEKADGNLEGIADMYTNLGISLADQGEYHAALDYLRQAGDIYSTTSSEFNQANIDIEIGRTFLLSKDYPTALNYLNKGLVVAQSSGYLPLESAALKNLSELYHKLNRFKEAYAAITSYNIIKDSLDRNQRTTEIGWLQVKYTKEKLQVEIERLKAEKIDKDLTISEQRRSQVFLIGTSLLVLLTLLGMYLYLRLRHHRKQMQFEKQRATQLQQIDQLKDQFLANTSHELRTPLNGIIGLADSLIDGVTGKLDEKTIDNLRLISSSGKRLSNLVNDILDFSKAKNKDLNLFFQPVDMFIVADLVVKSSEVLLGNKPVSIENNIPKNIPLVHADENRIQQILFNLIGNAVKFTEKGKITLSSEIKEENVVFRVSDTGMGIPKEKFDSIFKSFEQLDGSDTRNYGGTGLGLAVTKQLVELHGGSISVESTPGLGSTFSFDLPRSKVNGDNRLISTPPSNLIPASREFKGEKTVSDSPEPLQTVSTNSNNLVSILLIDDEPVNLKVLENHLRLHGYTVDKALNGKEALDKLKNKEFDLVVLDVMMPNMSGFEVCQKIRLDHLPNKLPVIMLTAKNTVADLLRGFEVGVNDYLTKPFSKDELLTRIRTHLRLQKLYKASDQFVPIEFLKAIGRESISDARIGDYTNKEFSIVFSDIRNYTGLSEKLTPEENFNFINGYVGRMGPSIKNYQGFINQYLGDAILAIYPKEVEYALDSAISMQGAIQHYNAERKIKGRNEIAVGMGLHTGELILGIIGDVDRADPATLADTVNIASRMEGLTKYFGVKILVSEDVYRQIQNPGKYEFRCLGKIQLKGKTQSILMYECLNGETTAVHQLKSATLQDFNSGLNYYQAGEFQSAIQAFQVVLIANPDDTVVQYFMNKADYHNKSGCPPDWSGVEIMLQK